MKHPKKRPDLNLTLTFTPFAEEPPPAEEDLLIVIVHRMGDTEWTLAYRDLDESGEPEQAITIRYPEHRRKLKHVPAGWCWAVLPLDLPDDEPEDFLSVYRDFVDEEV